MAAAATTGEGDREIAESSLHCQIARSLCNINIHYTGAMFDQKNAQAVG
jgi:hypothetical protein